MCGIFAYITNIDDINKYTNIYNFNFIEKQFLKGKSRGPESTKTIIKEYESTIVYLGFHRLAINGLDEQSNQPMCIDNIYLICNGEIYNYRSFNIPFETKSDCEVIIHLYKLYGIDYLLELLDGVFAFVLYDANIQKIYAARDPYGVRPLYYYNSCGIGFASEIKQLNTFSISVKHVEPGTYLEVNLRKNHYPEITKTQRYSTFGFSKLILNNIYDVYGIVYQSLYNAVKKRVSCTERPIACLLSGGLDSSVITALVNSFLPKGVLETYSIGLEGSTDLVYAQKVADHLGTKHTQIILTENEFFHSIPEVIKAIETYDTTTVRASVGNYLVGKYISEHSQAKVIFNGDGSDELMGGYLYFNKAPDVIEFDRECKRLLRDIHAFDVLRSDHCISVHGLEPRTPFLDRSFVQNYLAIPAEIRCHRFNDKPEKFILRECIEFMNDKLLPKEVLYRTKEAFSDGVSSLERSWYKVIQEKVQSMEFNKTIFIHNKPETHEQRYYRTVFENEFPNMGHIVPYFWMPKWSTTSDPSARTL
jgi:asparagine synthase (glutamine-hydrolysing)